MIRQAGDHYAAGDEGFTGAAYAFGVFGIPSRDRRDEDRAQEARRGARVIRRFAWGVWQNVVRNASPVQRVYHVAVVRVFVPRNGKPFFRPGWDIDDARIGVFQR